MEIEDRILEFLRNHLGDFYVFRQVAKYKGENTTQASQYKTEKWLEGELVIFFWSAGTKCIPQYSDSLWDIFLPGCSPEQKAHFLALKCLADSDQRPAKDFEKVRTDIDTISGHNSTKSDACLILILPIGINNSYTEQMFTLIRNTSGFSQLKQYERDLLFENNATEGIKVLFLRKSIDTLGHTAHNKQNNVAGRKDQ